MVDREQARGIEDRLIIEGHVDRIARLGPCGDQIILRLDPAEDSIFMIEDKHMVLVLKARLAMDEPDLILLKLPQKDFALLVQNDIQAKVEFIDRDLPDDARLGIKAAFIEIGKV